jgi:hypothetical protein
MSSAFESPEGGELMIDIGELFTSLDRDATKLDSGLEHGLDWTMDRAHGKTFAWRFTYC